MTPLLALVIIAVVIIAVLSVRRGAAALDILPPLSLAFVAACIAFNKVGSPQYMTWLAVPVILGLSTRLAGHGRSFRSPATIVLVLGALTQAFYPYLYSYLLGLNVVMLVVLSVRNALVVVLLGWAVVAVWRASSGRDESVADDSASGQPRAWPFTTPKRTAERDRLDADSLST
jgi:ABC-type multidrug transport system fused ATPase/permease subunit